MDISVCSCRESYGDYERYDGQERYGDGTWAPLQGTDCWTLLVLGSAGTWDRIAGIDFKGLEKRELFAIFDIGS